MFLPLAAAAPTSDDFARRLDMPISAVPSMIAAIPVVEPSAAMSNVVPGCCGLELFRQLRNEFGAEGVGTLDDEAIGFGFSEAKRNCQSEKDRGLVSY